MEKLPYEVLSNIFSLLLAKQLAQMRCVCKSWNALLSESSFIKSHLHRSIHNKDGILLFFRLGFSFDRFPFSARPSRSPHIELANFIKLPTNPQSTDAKGYVIGSVNGLICFEYGSHDDDVVQISNPSLSVVLTLPPCPLPKGDAVVNHFRFGYDPTTDDYKVVKLTRVKKPPTSMLPLPEVEVYSMRKGSWELITARLPSHIKNIYDTDHVCVDGHDGHLHWVANTSFEGKEVTILVFDLGAETFGEISLPDSILHLHNYNYTAVGVLSGKLCVVSFSRDGGCQVWVMDEYESWVKHHAFSQFSGKITLFGFTSRGEFLFQDDKDDGGRFHLYDQIAAQTRTFEITGGIDINVIVEYVDSLVWVSRDKHDQHQISISQFQS